MTYEEALNIASQLWCLPQHSHKEMDSELCLSIAQAILDAEKRGVEKERERCAKKVENYLIYTGPGSIDPEPIQKILAEAIRKVE